MFPSSAIQILQQTPTRLVIWDPPYYGMGIILMVIGAVGLLFTGWGLVSMWDSSKPLQKNLWPLLFPGIFACVFALPGLGVMSSKTLTLSMETQTISIDSKYMLMFPEHQSMPLEAIDRVVVETADAGTYRLNFVLKSGQTWLEGSYDDRGGYYAAADAINHFLQSNHQ